jgi:hypothetical protein
LSLSADGFPAMAARARRQPSRHTLQIEVWRTTSPIRV